MFTDISASTRVAERPEWLVCLSYVRRGDTLLVHSLDRIASCEAMAVQTILDLEQRGIHLRSLREPDIDTADPNGRWWGVTRTLQQLRSKAEPDSPSHRYRRIRRNPEGRPPMMTPERLSAARSLRKSGHTVARIAALLGVGVTTIITTFAEEAERNATDPR